MAHSLPTQIYEAQQMLDSALLRLRTGIRVEEGKPSHNPDTVKRLKYAAGLVEQAKELLT